MSSMTQLAVSVEGVTSASLDSDDLREACLIAAGQLASAEQDFTLMAVLATTPRLATYSDPDELQRLLDEATRASSLAVTESPTLPRAQVLTDPEGFDVVARWTVVSTPVFELDGDVIRATPEGWEFDTFEGGVVAFRGVDVESGHYVDKDGELVELGALADLWTAFRPEALIVTAKTAPMSSCVLPVTTKLAELASTALATASPLLISEAGPAVDSQVLA